MTLVPSALQLLPGESESEGGDGESSPPAHSLVHPKASTISGIFLLSPVKPLLVFSAGP